MRDTSNQTTSVTRYRVSLQLAGALASGDLGPEGVTTAHVDATTMNVGNLVAANAVSLTPGGAGGGETLTGVRFSASAYSGPLVEKRVADSARWGVGARGDATEVYAGVGGRVALGHALNDATVAEGLSVVRPVGAATANVGINAPSPVAALDVVGNVRCTAIQHRNWVSFPDQRFVIDPFRYTMQDRFSTLAGSELGTVTVTFSGGHSSRADFTQFTNIFNTRNVDAGEGWTACSPAPVGSGTYTTNEQGTTLSGTARVIRYFQTGSYVTDAFLTSGSGFAAATTAIRGPHLTFTFPYMLSLRHVQIYAPQNTTATSEKRDSPHQILAVGTDDAVVTASTVWREIDTITRTEMPVHATVPRTTWHYEVSKTQGLATAYRTVRLILYSVDDRVPNYATGIIGHPTNTTNNNNTNASVSWVFRMNLAGVRVPYTQAPAAPSIPDAQAGAVSSQVAASYEMRNPLSFQGFMAFAFATNSSTVGFDISGNYRNLQVVGSTFPTYNLTTAPRMTYSATLHGSRSALTIVDLATDGYSAEVLFRVTAVSELTDHLTPVLFSYTGLGPSITTIRPLCDGVVLSLSRTEWPPTTGVASGGSWTKDASDTVVGINGVVYRKYKFTLTGAPYGNGQYVAWSNTISNYTNGDSYSADEWPPSGAFDKTRATSSTRTGWQTADAAYTNSADANPAPQLFIQLPTGIVLRSYGLQPRGDGGSGAQAPRAWEVHGSNDGTNWTLLDTRSDQTTWPNAGGVGVQTREFATTSNTTSAFSYFRLTVFRNNAGSPGTIHVGEWRLFSTPYQLNATFEAEWPPHQAYMVGTGGSSWVKDAGDTVVGIDSVVYRKYKFTASQWSYGNGQYVAWANSILNYNNGNSYADQEWPPSGAFDKFVVTAANGKNGYGAAGASFTNSADATTPPQLFIQLPTDIVLSSYAIVAQTTTDQTPSSWQVHGSNTGSTTEADWTPLDSRQGVTGWGNSEMRVYFPQTPSATAFRYFRLTMLRNNRATAGNMTLAEWRLFSRETLTIATGAEIALGDAETPTSGWYHAVYVAPPSSSPKWYVNGVEVAVQHTAPVGRPPAVYNFARHFSALPGALCPRNGDFALGRFFTEALTSQQVTALYAAARRDGNPYALPG